MKSVSMRFILRMLIVFSYQLTYGNNESENPFKIPLHLVNPQQEYPNIFEDVGMTDYFALIPSLSGGYCKIVVWQIPNMNKALSCMLAATTSVQNVSTVLYRNGRLAAYLDPALTSVVAERLAENKSGNDFGTNTVNSMTGRMDYYPRIWEEWPVSPISEGREGYKYVNILTNYLSSIERLYGKDLCFDVALLPSFGSSGVEEGEKISAVFIREMSEEQIIQRQKTLLKQLLRYAKVLPDSREPNPFSYYQVLCFGEDGLPENIEDGWKKFELCMSLMFQHMEKTNEIELIAVYSDINLILFRGSKNAYKLMYGLLWWN